MWRSWGRRCQPTVLLVVACTWCWAGPASAADDAGASLLLPLDEQAREFWIAERGGYGGGDIAAAALLGRSGDLDQRRPRARLDLSPIAEELLGFLRLHGLPLNEQRDKEGNGPVGVYADVSVGKDLPAVSFHLGDRPIEPLGAFYSADRGFRCAVVWPVQRFTLRVEAGEDSEFGYYAIAGLQWVHPRLPLAAGIGVPMNLRDANGDIGVIFQFRMTLD